MSDNISNAFNFLDTKIHKINACIETYVSKFGTISSATFFAILRTTESEVIRTCQVPDNRMVRNNLRAYLLFKLEEEVDKA